VGAVGVLCCCELLSDVAGDEGAASVGDGDLLAVASSPNLMLAAVAVLNPSLMLGEFPELLVGHALRVACLVDRLPCSLCPCAPRAALLLSLTLL